MKKQISMWLSTIPVILLIPYLVTIAFNRADRALVFQTPDAEMCLPVLLSLQISEEYEPETLKAQSVIARSNLELELEEGKNLFCILGEAGKKAKNTYSIFSFPFFERDMEVYGEAVKATKGQVLTYEKKRKRIPYHEVSSGMTRDGEEVFHSAEYAYLQSVDSSMDKNAEDYLESSYVAAVQMPRELVIKSRDSAGYVTALAADKKILEGEAFRQGMGLASANFRIQKIGERYRFLCKGKGHGLGFSQYGGNTLAKEGKTWEEILETYFPGMEIEEIL